MSLRHALLGFLNYGPMTGYELKKFFDVSVSHFWSAELSQIYPALKQMEAEGLIETKVEFQEGRPNRKVCSITEDGRQELLDWMRRPTEPEQVREPILVKTFFGSTISTEELTRVLKERREASKEYIAYLEKCEQLVKAFATQIGLERDAAFWALTPSLGLKLCRAEMEWIDEAIDAIGLTDQQAWEQAHAVEGACPGPEHAIDVRTAVEILDRVKNAISGRAAWVSPGKAMKAQ
jgi:DNA-binding PadR family transcriptional regulator